MRCFSTAAALALVFGLVACQPALNWRQARFEAADLVALLPCKPDRGQRAVALAGQELELHMLGCDAGGSTYALSQAELPEAALAGAALAQWKAATLVNMRASASKDVPFVPRGSLALPQSVRMAATGQRADGRAVAAEAVWFAQVHGARVHLFHAVVYADRIPPEAAETFFSGLQLP